VTFSFSFIFTYIMILLHQLLNRMWLN